MNFSQQFDEPMNSDMDSDLSELFSELERIDLKLQHYYYQGYHDAGSLAENFLLAEEEVQARLLRQQGRPHWAMAANRPAIQQNDQLMDETLPDRLSLLTARFELTPFERDVLLLGLLPHFDSRYYALFALLQSNRQKSLPTFEFALELLTCSWQGKNVHQVSFLPQSPLNSRRLLALHQGQKNAVWLQTQFLTDNTVYHFLLGNRCLPPSLEYCVSWSALWSDKNGWCPQTLQQRLADLLLTDRDTEKPLVLLRGMSGSSRGLAVTHSMACAGINTLTMDMLKLPEDDLLAQRLLADTVREVCMYDACLILRNFSVLAEERKALAAGLSELLNTLNLRVVGLTEPHSPPVWINQLPVVQLDMPAFSHSEKSALLHDSLPAEIVDAIDVPALSRRFSFTPESLPMILAEARHYQLQRDRQGELQDCDLRKALHLRAQQNFGKLAQRVTPKRTLNDLIVSDGLSRQLKEILAAISYRDQILAQGFDNKVGYGTGISALFYGDSGTGKTMAAEVLAGHLGVDLIKVDLSTVVNKYIGETEKNLSRIFDMAEADAGVLFFDEADALFGKRSETKDAQDRHANIEVSYLLQRLESYPGLVILATNNRSHLDNAFSRRFTFMTRFSFPDVELRERMWRAIWPEQIALAESINFSELAERADVTGANIRNIALLSSILAAEDRCEVIQPQHIDQAIKREMAKVGRLII